MAHGPEASALVDAASRRLPRSRGAGWVTPAFLLLAFWLRLHHLGADSLWIDEIASVGFARLPWAALFGPIAALEPTPPTYYAILKAWMVLVPVREFTLRLPSAIASAAAVPLVFLFARRAFGWQAGLLAGLLLALAPMHVALAQNARVYAFVLLAFAAGLVSAQAYVAAPGAPRGRWALAGLALSAAVLLSLHATGLFAVAALGIYIAVALAVEGRAGIRTLAPPALAVLGAAVPAGWWYLGAVAIARDPNSSLAWMEVPGLEDVALILRDTFVAPTGRAMPLSAAVGVLAGIWAAVVAVRRRDPQSLGTFAALAFVLLAMPLASQVRPLLLPRTLAFSVAVAAALLAAGAVAVPGRWPRALTVLLLLGAEVCGTADYFAHGGEHQPFRETVALLGRIVGPGEPVVVSDAFDAVAVEHYWNGRPMRLIAAVDPRVRLEREATRLMTSALLVEPWALCDALGSEPRVWLLAYPGFRPRVAGQIAAALTAAGGQASAVLAVASEFRSLMRWDGVECRVSER
jgi:4-amino-4-deoxy-L-arabinose transferase-like glycosyltransferase